MLVLYVQLVVCNEVHQGWCNHGCIKSLQHFRVRVQTLPHHSVHASAPLIHAHDIGDRTGTWPDSRPDCHISVQRLSYCLSFTEALLAMPRARLETAGSNLCRQRLVLRLNGSRSLSTPALMKVRRAAEAKDNRAHAVCMQFVIHSRLNQVKLLPNQLPLSYNNTPRLWLAAVFVNRGSLLVK